jgi:hypothetical protein
VDPSLVIFFHVRESHLALGYQGVDRFIQEGIGMSVNDLFLKLV